MNAKSKNVRRILFRVILAVLLALIATIVILFYTSFVMRVAWEGEAQNLDELVDGWASLRDIPGVILYVEEGDEVVYAQASGTTRKNGEESLTPDTPFHIASVGKLFTSATVLRLYEQGLLDLDAPAAQYVPSETLSGLVVVDGEDLSDMITVRQLLRHRAGLPSTDGDPLFGLWIVSQPDRERTPQELLDHARRIGAVGPPGAQRRYSSPGYFLLGLVIEGVTNRPYHEVVRAEIFEPLGMDDTFESSKELPSDAEVLHHYVGWIDFAQIHPSFEFADGGFVSTAPDLARFGHSMARGNLFDKPETHTLFTEVQEQSVSDPDLYFTLGPNVVRPEGEPNYLYHGGYWGVLLAVYPAQDIVTTFALGQAQADGRTFWRHVQEHLASNLGVQAQPTAGPASRN